MAERKRDMKKQAEWSRAYNDKTYDRLYVFVPKARKKEIQDYVKSSILYNSVNDYINKLIENDLNNKEDNN